MSKYSCPHCGEFFESAFNIWENHVKICRNHTPDQRLATKVENKVKGFRRTV